MRIVHRSIPELVLSLHVVSIFWGKSSTCPVIRAVEIKTTVKSTSFSVVVFSIEYLQNIPTYEFIISIQMNYDWVLTTVTMICIVVICHGSLSFCVVNVYVFWMRNPVKFKVLPVQLITAVPWSVISDDQKVVGVVLCENRVEIVLQAELIIVSIAGSYNAHG